MRRLLYLLLTAAALTACSTPQQTRYFTLPDSQFSLPDQHGQEIAVQTILADPLNNGGLVYQTDAHSLNFARNHLWAAPLNQALNASFSNKLNRIGNARYVFVPAGRSQSSLILKIYIEAFQGTYQGSTQINGYAVWPDGRSRNFQIDTPQEQDGYPAMIESLDRGVYAAAATISR
ncbi:PqiC family protein [Neisseria sp. S1]|uniref:PqiC family protein n=1 Tax=Neisseria sp. S1 TaxID=3318354 RepID=UPI003A89FB6F